MVEYSNGFRDQSWVFLAAGLAVIVVAAYGLWVNLTVVCLLGFKKPDPRDDASLRLRQRYDLIRPTIASDAFTSVFVVPIALILVVTNSEIQFGLGIWTGESRSLLGRLMLVLMSLEAAGRWNQSCLVLVDEQHETRTGTRYTVIRYAMLAVNILFSLLVVVWSQYQASVRQTEELQVAVCAACGAITLFCNVYLVMDLQRTTQGTAGMVATVFSVVLLLAEVLAAVAHGLDATLPLDARNTAFLEDASQSTSELYWSLAMSATLLSIGCVFVVTFLSSLRGETGKLYTQVAPMYGCCGKGEYTDLSKGVSGAFDEYTGDPVSATEMMPREGSDFSRSSSRSGSSSIPY